MIHTYCNAYQEDEFMLYLNQFNNDLIERSFFFEYEDLYEEPDYESINNMDKNSKKEEPPRKEQKNRNFYIMM